MNLPIKPFPDEYVLGWRGRLKFLNHYPSVKFLLEDLRREFPIDGVEGFTRSNVPQLFVYAKAAGMGVTEFVNKHSLMPFLRAFDVKNFGVEKWGDFAVNFISTRGTSKLKNGAWFCSDCLKEDLSERGIPYWRRQHQLPAVDWCVRHKKRLLVVGSSTAFDSPPPLKHAEPDDCDTLDCVHPVVQRYVALADYILNRQDVIDYHLVTYFLGARALELGLIDCDGVDVCLSSRVKAALPKAWLEGFDKGKNESNLISVFQKTSNQRATELYLLLFAFVYDSSERVEVEFDKINHMTSLLPMSGGSRVGGLLMGELIYSEYVRNKGLISEMEASSSLCAEELEHYLKLYGLPTLGPENRVEIEALKDFLLGKPLVNVCDVYRVETTALEQLLRVIGARVARALELIDKTTVVEPTLQW